MPETVKSLTPAPYNPRKIGPEADENLEKSMEYFGDISGIVFNIRTGNLVGGHQRIKHLDASWPITKVPHKDSVGTVAIGHIDTPFGRWQYREVDWDERKEKEANLAANKHGGQWEYPKLKEILLELDDGAGDLSITGFTEDELRDLIDFGSDASKNEDDIPSIASGKSKAKPGEIWILGDHRVMCGDSTDPKNWEKLMGGGLGAMVHTDPPYGVSYESRSGKHEKIANDDKRSDDLAAFLSKVFKQLVKSTSETAGFYVWHATSTRDDFSFAMKSAGLMERQYLIWSKNGISMGWSDYRWSHEPCFYASKQGRDPSFYGGRAEPTVWSASLSQKAGTATVIGPGFVLTDGKGGKLFIQAKSPRDAKIRSLRAIPGQKIYIYPESENNSIWEVARETNVDHPTQKPVELGRRAIMNSSKEGDIVLDPFLGSGCTLIAAEATGRKCYGMELDGKYVDCIVKRWEQFTGKTAQRA